MRDELKFITCVAISINLPKFFDSEMILGNDPCRPGLTIVMREPNGVGKCSPSDQSNSLTAAHKRECNHSIIVIGITHSIDYTIFLSIRV